MSMRLEQSRADDASLLPSRQADDDASHLAQLLAQTKASPERFEEIIRNALVTNDEPQPQTGHTQQLEALRVTLYEGLDALRHEQDVVLPGIGHAMSMFRSEVRLYQLGYIQAIRRTNMLLGTVAVIQLLIIAYFLWATLQI